MVQVVPWSAPASGTRFPTPPCVHCTIEKQFLEGEKGNLHDGVNMEVHDTPLDERICRSSTRSKKHRSGHRKAVHLKYRKSIFVNIGLTCG